MKKLKKILAVSTAVSVLSLSLCLPTDCVSAANSNNAVSYTVFSLKRGGTCKTQYTLNPVDTLSSTNARAVIGDDTRVVDFSKSGVVKINFTASNGESYWGTGFVVDEHTIATAAHCVCEQTNGKNAVPAGKRSCKHLRLFYQHENNVSRQGYPRGVCGVSCDPLRAHSLRHVDAGRDRRRDGVEPHRSPLAHARLVRRGRRADGGALPARKACTIPAEAGRRKGNNMNEKLFDYIAVCPTAFHTCAHSADMLRESGYTELCEAQRWEIVPGGKYFVTRNGSSLIAFRVPAGEIAGFMMTAAHGDSPAFKISAGHNPLGTYGSRQAAARHGTLRLVDIHRCGSRSALLRPHLGPAPRRTVQIIGPVQPSETLFYVPLHMLYRS